MKKVLFLLATILVTSPAFAQLEFQVETPEGDLINEGDVVAFNVLTSPEAYLDFFVRNLSATPINMKIEFVSAQNADGSEMELCFGLCYTGITIGNSYPGGPDVITIDPGQTQPTAGDHFYNFDDGGGNPVNYVFRFYHVDGAGNEIGGDLSFTYRYDPNLSVTDFSTVNADLGSTVINELLTIDSREELNVTVYNMLGAVVAQYKAVVGRNDFNLSNLSSQMYVVELSNKEGASQKVKIAKR